MIYEKYNLGDKMEIIKFRRVTRRESCKARKFATEILKFFRKSMHDKFVFTYKLVVKFL